MATAQNLEQGTSNFTVNVGNTERFASVIGGGILALLGQSRNSIRSLLLSSIAGYLIYRGLTGHCVVYEALDVNSLPKDEHYKRPNRVSVPHDQGVKIEKSVLVHRPASELYSFWHNLENLPRFMDHLDSVTVLDNNRSHWVATGPANTKIEWDAEIINDVMNERIGWRSLPGSEIENAGSVVFTQMPGDRGTKVEVTMKYNPPAGKVGIAVAKLLGDDPEREVATELRHFKQIMETGVVTTVEGQPTARQ